MTPSLRLPVTARLLTTRSTGCLGDGCGEAVTPMPGEFVVLVGGRCAADADRTDDVPVDHESACRLAAGQLRPDAAPTAGHRTPGPRSPCWDGDTARPCVPCRSRRRRSPPARRRAGDVDELAGLVDDGRDGGDSTLGNRGGNRPGGQLGTLERQCRHADRREGGGGACVRDPSSSSGVSPLVPMAPTTSVPFPSSHERDAAGQRTGAASASAPSRPSLTCFSISRLGRTKMAAVRALSTATAADAACAEGVRRMCRTVPERSTIAM